MDKQWKWIKAVVIASLVIAIIKPAGAAYAEAGQAPVPREISAVYLQDAAPSTTASNVSGTSPGYIYRFLSEAVTLQGVEQAQDFYYQVPKAELGDNNYIELEWRQSDLLLASQSTLTVMVDDKPLTSVRLDGEENHVRIPLGPEEMSPGYHKLTLSKYSVIADNYCVDQYNPANWLKITPTSHVFMDTRSNWTASDLLKDFPHPFIEQGMQEEVYGVIVVPDHPSAEIIASSLQVSSYLSSLTATRKAMPIKTESEWLSSAEFTHALAMGGTGQWNGPVKNILDNHPLELQGEELSLDNFSVTDNQTGLTKQMLLVSAETDRAIADKIRVLTDSKLAKQLTGNHLIIRETPQPQTDAGPTKPLTLSSYGYGHVLLDTVHPSTDRWTLRIPSYWKLTGEASLELKLKTSPLLTHELEEYKRNKKTRKASANQQEKEEGSIALGTSRTALTVTINEIPTSVPLQGGEGQDGSYTVSIPLTRYIEDPDFNGVLELTFAANIVEPEEVCYPDRNGGRWIFIDKESVVQLPHEIIGNDSFQYWPAPFVNDRGLDQTAFILPQEVNGSTLKQLSLLMNEMVGDTGNLNRPVVFSEPLSADAVQSLKDFNIVLLGDIGLYPSLQQEKDKLKLQSENGRLSLAKYNVIGETAEYAAWIQPSVWNKDKRMAVFQPANGQEGFTHPQLLQFLKNEQENHSLVIMSRSQEVWSVSLDPQQSQGSQGEESPSPSKGAGLSKFSAWLLVLLPVLFLVLLFVFIRLWKKQKKNN